MRSLKQALNDFVKRADIDKPIAQGSALLMWDEIVGPNVINNTV
jgi:predicted nucleic acid-binding Zn ribbon protein